MSGTSLDLRKYLVTTFVFPRINLILYFVLFGLLIVISTRSTISLFPSFLYIRESPIWKGEVRVLVCVESIQTLFDGLTRSMTNFCDTVSLITSYSTYGLKSIGLPVLGSFLVHTEAKENLNVEYLDIDPTLLQNPENLIKPD